MTTVEWRTVSYLPPNIEVSNEGDVRKILSNSEYELATGSISNGTRMVSVSGKQYAIHRLVADAFIPNPEGLPRVIHKDGNKLNNSISNLERASRSYNVVQSIKQGNSLNHLVKCQETGKVYASIRSASYDTMLQQELIAWAIESGTTICGLTFCKDVKVESDTEVVYYSLDDIKQAASKASDVKKMMKMLSKC